MAHASKPLVDDAQSRSCTLETHETKETKKNLRHIALDQASKTTRSSSARGSLRRVGTCRFTVATCRTIRRSDLKNDSPDSAVAFQTDSAPIRLYSRAKETQSLV